MGIFVSKKLIIVVGLLVGAAISGCSTNGKVIEESAQLEPEVKVEATNTYPVEWYKDTVTKREIDKVTSRVVGALVNTDGLRFGDIWALNSTDGARILCGYVSIKNPDGEYDGMRMFSLLSTEYVAFQTGGEGDLFPEVCQPRVMHPEPVYIK